MARIRQQQQLVLKNVNNTQVGPAGATQGQGHCDYIMNGDSCEPSIIINGDGCEPVWPSSNAL